MSIRVIGGKQYIGNGDDDLLVLDARQLLKSRIDLGAGYDTLAVTANGDLAFSASSVLSMKGVDALDFSRLGAGQLAVTLSDALVSQSDARVLTIVSGINGIDALSTSAVTAGRIMIAGTGDVHLADGAGSAVTIADGASVHLHGGSGNDRITANATGTLLDGGGGNDVLTAGAGADAVSFAPGGGSDTVLAFDAAHDTLALDGFAFPNLNAVEALTIDTPAGAVIDLGNGDTIRFDGVSRAALLAATITADGHQLVHQPPTVEIGTGVTAAAFNALIAAAEAGTTFVMLDGVHQFDAPLVIARSDVTIRGQSEAGTVLRFSLAAGSEADAIQVTGGGKSYVGLAQSAIAAGQAVVDLAPGHGLHAGDALYLYQPNTQEYLDANGWTNVSWSDADQRPFREFIATIDHVDGDKAYLSAPVPYAMDLGETRVFNVDMLHGVALGDFTVTYDLGTANPYDFVNAAPGYDGTSALQLTFVDGAVLSGITIRDAASNGLALTSSIGVAGTGITVDGAHDKGGDGNGYGLLLTESFNNDFTGMSLLNGRHALVFSAWSAETGNTVRIDTANRDINFHGSPDLGNTVLVGRAVLQYDPAQDTSGTTSIWPLVSHGGTNHALTDIYGGNTVAFAYAVGSTANDDIRGTSGDDYLNAGFGYDSLSGGDGNDYIVGGTRKDTMTGGSGSDTFLLRMGDDLDTITDFTFGPGGDKLVISGNPAVTSVANLTLTQYGDDLWLRYGANSTVILHNHTAADLDAANIVFDPTGAMTATLYSGGGLFE